jgi:hypothetical protein
VADCALGKYAKSHLIKWSFGIVCVNESIQKPRQSPISTDSTAPPSIDKAHLLGADSLALAPPVFCRDRVFSGP